MKRPAQKPEVTAARKTLDELGARYMAAPPIREIRMALWAELTAARAGYEAAKQGGRQPATEGAESA